MKWFGNRSEVVDPNEYHLAAIWKTYAYWAFWVGVAFFSIYPTCNWLTSQRDDISFLYFDQELMIPFVPEFFWVYMSMYLLFFLPPFFLRVSQLEVLGKRIIIGTLISAVIFLLFPSQLGFERVIPEGFYYDLYSQIFTLDLPYNMAPSLHIVYSGFILFAVYSAVESKSVRIFAILWLLFIALSTLLVHQHHMIDIVLALFLIGVINYKVIKGGKNV